MDGRQTQVIANSYTEVANAVKTFKIDAVTIQREYKSSNRKGKVKTVWFFTPVFGVKIFVHFAYWQILHNVLKWPPGRARPGRNFHYTMPRPICQVKSMRKMHKYFFPFLCRLPIEICFWICYNIHVSWGQTVGRWLWRVSTPKKKFLTNIKKYVIIFIQGKGSPSKRT